MKKSWLIRALLLTAYCVPFAFFSVKGDITSGTMVYYGVMIVSFVILYRCALKTDNVPIIFIGNILSFLMSVAINFLVAKSGGVGLDGNLSYIPLWLVLASMGFAVFVGMAAGYFPALRAMRLSPLAAIRNN